MQKLKILSLDFFSWNKDHFNHIQGKLKILNVQLKEIYSKNLLTFNLNIDNVLNQELDEQLSRLDSLWCQKTRELQITDEERNTKLFHASIAIKMNNFYTFFKTFLWNYILGSQSYWELICDKFC